MRYLIGEIRFALKIEMGKKSERKKCQWVFACLLANNDTVSSVIVSQNFLISISLPKNIFFSNLLHVMSKRIDSKHQKSVTHVNCSRIDHISDLIGDF